MHVQNLCFQHKKNDPYFFENLSFDLAKGKIHALHGKNGIGKTVLFNLIGKKNYGHAVVTGEIKCEGAVSLVNQRFDLMIADQFSFEENLRFACMNTFPSPFASLKKPFYPFEPLLEKFHINFSMPAYRLSGGQRQILALLMVLQKNPQILLLDEPTATLDEENAIMVFEFLKTLTEKNLTFLVICHDKELIDRFTDGTRLALKMAASGCRYLV